MVNFDPTPGAEIRKTRPALVLQNDIANRHSPITIVAAVTSHFGDRLYPTEVFVEAPDQAQPASIKTRRVAVDNIRDALAVPDVCGYERDSGYDLTLRIGSVMVEAIGVVAVLVQLS